VDAGSVVTLDGSSSLDIDGGITAYLWTQVGGPAVALSDPASSQPSFTAPNVGPEGASLIQFNGHRHRRGCRFHTENDHCYEVEVIKKYRE
jgi:hypothetical protein